MPKLTVNGKEVEFTPGMTVLQACELAGAEIPRFCYHERLEIAGNCRMCLVQIEGGPPKPAASCAMPAAENMVIHTDSPMVKKAREGVMEFLLINHPLDCPICDQGGECDLQDQAMAYGKGTSRYDENKRAVPDKNMGALIKTQMTRCIHCTRCVRFMEDIAGTAEIGAIYRGEKMQITTALERSVTSELSGNVIDLCPVGALTSKPYAFRARPWELTKTESIDVLDAVGSNIRIDTKGKEVLRILPRLNEDINEEWISDKARFACDGLMLQRLDRPYVRKKGKLVEASFKDAYHAISAKIHELAPKEIAAIAGDLADCESMFVLKELLTNLKVANMDCRSDGALSDANNRSSYIFNTSIKEIENADAILLIGTNPRHEAPIINARIRKAWLKTGLKIANIGEEVDLTYPVIQLGNSPQIIEELIAGKHEFSKDLSKAKHPVVIIGSAVLNRKDSEAILFEINNLCKKYNVISDEWNGFNVLQRAASRVGGLDLGFVPQKSGKATKEIYAAARKGDIKLLYLLGVDDFDAELSKEDLKDCFVVYQGHHGDKGAVIADVILPGAAYTEKTAIYVNTEGRVQSTSLAIYPPYQAMADWEIIAGLAKYLKHDTGFKNLSDVRNAMIRKYPVFGNYDVVSRAEIMEFGSQGKISDKGFENPIKNFYMTDPISRVSKTMARVYATILDKNNESKVA